MNFFNRYFHFVLWISFIGGVSCGRTDPPLSVAPQNSSCAPKYFLSQAPTQGNAWAFMPDPLVSSGDSHLSPLSTQLDSYRSSVRLAHLDGSGILKGSYVQVVNGLNCDWGFGAFSPTGQFTYSQKDFRFQEAMAYYFGDIYRSQLDQVGYLQSRGSVFLVAHCEKNDNAYFARGIDSLGRWIEMVCLGDSVSSPGAYYGDDGIVTIHELQHATTGGNYSFSEDLNQLFYDEAGALNEAVSDYMGLSFLDAFINPSSSWDPRIFSRWALGTFDPAGSHARGAHLCPTYDSHYPNCDRFPAFEVPSATNGYSSTMSYVYPDGLGWPFEDSRHSRDLSEIYKNTTYQEEIHNAGIILLGTLWDLYSAIKKNHSGQGEFAYKAVAQLILESIRHLPQPNLVTQHSPVHFIGLASQMVTFAGLMTGFTSADQASIQQVLVARGLYQFPTIQSSAWADVGAGTNMDIQESSTLGIYVADNPQLLKKWLLNLKKDPSILSQNQETGFNHLLDPGELVAVWFDIRNTSSLTAGGVMLTIASPDPDLEIFDDSLNRGYLSQSGWNETQIMYQKINGSAITSLLNSSGSSSSLPIGNTYFQTNPRFNASYRTAVWMKVSPTAQHGKVVHLSVEATPSNGVASSLIIPVTIH